MGSDAAETMALRRWHMTRPAPVNNVVCSYDGFHATLLPSRSAKNSPKALCASWEFCTSHAGLQATGIAGRHARDFCQIRRFIHARAST